MKWHGLNPMQCPVVYILGRAEGRVYVLKYVRVVNVRVNVHASDNVHVSVCAWNVYI